MTIISIVTVKESTGSVVFSRFISHIFFTDVAFSLVRAFNVIIIMNLAYMYYNNSFLTPLSINHWRNKLFHSNYCNFRSKIKLTYEKLVLIRFFICNN